MTELRFNALDFAIKSKGDDTPANVVKRADAYLAFLMAGAATATVTAPTPTASPLAEADGTVAARLDDPKVVAETEAVVVDRPTVSGDATSPKTDAAQGTSAQAGPASDATAASGSGAAPASTDAPAADGVATPSVSDVNAAVLAFNRANGREKTLALLNKFGGSKVPEIDASKHAELLAELRAGVAA